MGNTVLMNSETVEETGTQAVRNSADFQSLTGTFYQGVGKITDVNTWSGAEDSVEFKSIADGMRTDLERAQAIINDVGTDLQKTAGAFDDTVATNKARLSRV